MVALLFIVHMIITSFTFIVVNGREYFMFVYLIWFIKHEIILRLHPLLNCSC